MFPDFERFRRGKFTPSLRGQLIWFNSQDNKTWLIIGCLDLHFEPWRRQYGEPKMSFLSGRFAPNPQGKRWRGRRHIGWYINQRRPACQHPRHSHFLNSFSLETNQFGQRLVASRRGIPLLCTVYNPSSTLLSSSTQHDHCIDSHLGCALCSWARLVPSWIFPRFPLYWISSGSKRYLPRDQFNALLEHIRATADRFIQGWGDTPISPPSRDSQQFHSWSWLRGVSGRWNYPSCTRRTPSSEQGQTSCLMAMSRL